MTNLVQTLRALETLRTGNDQQAATVAAGISRRLAMFNDSPSAGDYFAEVERAERLVAAYAEVPER
jgi:hypothetical protein